MSIVIDLPDTMSSWINNDPRDESWANKLITLLKVIGRIEAGDKLYTEGGLFRVETIGLMQGIRRTFCGEGRLKNLERITCVVEHMTAYITAESPSVSHGSPKDQLLLRCIMSLHGSIGGLRNLSSSYGHDACAMAQIDCIIERIEGFHRQSLENHILKVKRVEFAIPLDEEEHGDSREGLHIDERDTACAS